MEKVCNLGKIVTLDYTLPKKQKPCEQKETNTQNLFFS